MIHAYHVVFGAYGFWLPNDPRGSWSDFVGSLELVRFGKATKSMERSVLTPAQDQLRRKAKEALRYPAVSFNGVQARAVGRGFASAVRTSGLTVWSCSILPEHVHLVIARHRYQVEYIVGRLKGEATKQLKQEGIHPLDQYADAAGEIPSPWAARCWKVYLDNEEAIEGAIGYVKDNPGKEGKPVQSWAFVVPFSGLDQGTVTYD